MVIIHHLLYHYFSMTEQPLVVRASSLSRVHDHTHTPQSVGPLWTSDQPDAETST